MDDVEQEQEDLRKISEYKKLREQLRNLQSGPMFSKSGYRINPQQ
jgi:hypothetical protein